MSAITTPSRSAVSGSKKSATNQLIWLRALLHLAALLPLFHLGILWLDDRLTANPIQRIEQLLGRASLDLLVLTLAITPIATLTGWKFLLKHRRALGLYAFFYFYLHFLVFAVLDYRLDSREIFRLILEKPFILIGSMAGLILIALAITSFKYWMKRLGRNWKRLHNTIYLASGLVVLHYALAVKGSLATLSGDLLGPFSMGFIVVLLLVLRILTRKQVR